MPVSIAWDHAEKRVLRQVFVGRWTVEEYRALVERTHKLMRGIKGTVHLILDGRESEGAPTALLSTARFVDEKVTANQGITVIVAVRPETRTIIEAARKIAPNATRKLFYTESLEDAHTLIREHDPSLLEKDFATPG